MHVVIIGAGRIGCTLAKWLIAAGHEVAVIARDPARCTPLENEIGSVTVMGEGTEGAVLERAGAARANVVVATCGSAADNMVACQLARHNFSVELTIGLVKSEDHARLFNLLGINSPVNVTELISHRFQETLSIDNVTQLMEISGPNASVLFTIRIPADSVNVDKLVKDITLPIGSLIPMIIGRDGTTWIPNDNTTLGPDDRVVVVAARTDLERIRELLG